MTSAFALMLAAASMLLSAWLYTRVQDERERSIRMACKDTNERHDRALAKLDILIEKVPPARRARAQQGRAGTVALIEALVPRRDCGKLVKRSVHPPPARSP